MLRLLAIPFGLIALLVVAVFWSGSATEGRADFVFVNRGDIITLDPNQMSYLQDMRIAYGIREGLYTYEPITLEAIPGVAKSHEVSPDKRIWTFHLRDNAKWSNGDPVTADDFVFAWRRMLESPGEYSYLFYYIKGAEQYLTDFAAGKSPDFSTVGIEAQGPHTLKVTLVDPVVFFLDVIAFPPFLPLHERSMAAFQTFIDDDVMNSFVDALNAAKSVQHLIDSKELPATFFARWGSDLEPDATPALRTFVAGVKGFDLSNSTRDEILSALKLFAAMKPYGRVKATTTTMAPTTTATTAPTTSPHVALANLSPAAKLDWLVRNNYLRRRYDGKFTRPPHVVTNGPFILKDWDFKTRLRLEKNPHYWDNKNVKSNSIEMSVVPDDLTQLLRYNSGAVDWVAAVPTEIAVELKAKGRKDLRSFLGFGTNFLSYMIRPKLNNGRDNPLADERVRLALSMVIDKQQIVDTVTRMGEIPAMTYVPPKVFPGYRDQPGVPYDPAKAKQLLAEAGYPNGGSLPGVTYLYTSETPSSKELAQLLARQWKQKLNLDIPIEAAESKIRRQRVNDRDYTICNANWIGDYADPSTFTDKYRSNSENNDSVWKSDRYDDLVFKATKEADVEKRLRMLEEAESILLKEAPIFPLYYLTNQYLFRDNVKGVNTNPRNMTMFKGVYVER